VGEVRNAKRKVEKYRALVNEIGVETKVNINGEEQSFAIKGGGKTSYKSGNIKCALGTA
jgi:hypothetical protein